MCKAIVAANYIVEQTNLYNSMHPERTIYMYTKRLQKLLYFSELCYMDRFGDCMFSDNFEAWPNGPVIPVIYDLFRVYQSGIMDPVETDQSDVLTDDEKECITEVLNRTNGMSVFELIEVSHDTKGPWTTCYENRVENGLDVRYQVITKQSMEDYIRKIGGFNKLFNSQS